MCTGPGKDKPPYSLLFSLLVEELQELGKEKLKWINDLGEEEEGFVYLLISGSDSRGKPGIIGHASPNGAYSCIYCLNPGEKLDKKTLEEEAALRKEMKSVLNLTQKRFPELVHQTREKYPERLVERILHFCYVI